MGIAEARFGAALALLERQIDDDANRAIRKTVLEMTRDVIVATPVSTGRARANWTFTLEVASVDPTEDTVVDWEAISSNIDQFEFGMVGWLTNNVPYIGKLNDGHSSQAPSGFIDAAVQRHAGDIA